MLVSINHATVTKIDASQIYQKKIKAYFFKSIFSINVVTVVTNVLN